MKSINFNQNIKSFAVNGDESNAIKLNPTDLGIFTRAEENFEELQSLEKQVRENEDKLTEMKDVEKRTRDLLNYIFNTDVCTPAFGNTNCLSPCDGEPLFVGFLNALMEIVEEEIEAENKKAEAKVSKYTSQVAKLTK